MSHKIRNIFILLLVMANTGGSVTDFMHIDFFIFKSGIFNFADVSIMIGMILLFINIYHKHYSAALESHYQS
jgi:lipoprotein signal peptidase